MFQRCLVGRLGYDFQTANALGCKWCAGPSWLLGISFPHQKSAEAVSNSSSQRNMPTFQNFTASCPMPRLRILGQPFLCFFWRSAFIESCGETDPLTTLGMNRRNPMSPGDSIASGVALCCYCHWLPYSSCWAQRLNRHCPKLYTICCW